MDSRRRGGEPGWPTRPRSRCRSWKPTAAASPAATVATTSTAASESGGKDAVHAGDLELFDRDQLRAHLGQQRVPQVALAGVGEVVNVLVEVDGDAEAAIP